MVMENTYDYLPEIHRPDGAVPYQTDWFIYKVFGIKIPRHWFSRPMVHPPKVIFGSSWLRFNWADVNKNDAVGFVAIKPEFNRLWPRAGPKPYQNSICWYIAICYPQIFGLTIPLPTFSFTSSKGKAIRLGVRWSEGPGERYYSILGFGTKDVYNG